jgi:hypothetical protein
LDDSIGSIELENTNLKEKIKELEETLMLVVEPDYLPDSEVLAFSRVYTP